jgi:small nuclear ribonucleoprotein (snRNP)-like protein
MNLLKNLRRLKKSKVTIETKIGSKIEGVIVRIDKTMNVTLRNGTITFKKKSEKRSLITIRGNMIRYFIFEDIDFFN